MPPFGENTFSVGSGSLRRTASTREQLLRVWYAVSERPLLENTFLNAPPFPARTFSPVKGILFMEPLLRQNKFCDPRAAVCGNPLFQNSFSVCSSRMRFRQALVLREQPLCRASVLDSRCPGSVGKVYLTCPLRTRTQFIGTHRTRTHLARGYGHKSLNTAENSSVVNIHTEYYRYQYYCIQGYVCDNCIVFCEKIGA